MRTFTLSSRGEDLTSLSSALVAFDEVFLPHMVEAYRFARWLTGNECGAEEAVQEVASQAAKSRLRCIAAASCENWEGDLWLYSRGWRGPSKSSRKDWPSEGPLTYNLQLILPYQGMTRGIRTELL